jgi:hypothetical protein
MMAVIFTCTPETPFKDDQDQMGGTILHVLTVEETRHIIPGERWVGTYAMPSSYIVMHCSVCDKRWSVPFPLHLGASLC